MYYVYILKSLNYRKSYVGSSNDVERRLQEHNTGKSLYTRRHKPWIILKTEEFNNYKEARKKELFYKSGIGREELRKLFT